MNVTSVDCSEACMIYIFILFFLVKVLHLKDRNKHKYNLTEEDSLYDYPFYYESFQTRLSASVNDMKYIMGM